MSGRVGEQVADLDAAGPLDELVHVDVVPSGRVVLYSLAQGLPVELGIGQRGLAGHVRPTWGITARSQHGVARVVVPVVTGVSVELGGEKRLQVRSGGEAGQTAAAG